jgi:signal transduction histidine kinase
VASASRQISNAASPQVEVIEFLAEMLAQSDEEGRVDDFYGRVCEAAARLTALTRVVIFRWEAERREARVAGGFGLDLGMFTGGVFTVERAPMARRALEEDRVIEAVVDDDGSLPAQYRGYVRSLNATRIVVCPVAARGRWIGVLIADRGGVVPLLEEGEREILWMIGKTTALASMARAATSQHERALALEQRIDLVRDIHDGVVQRLFGVSLALSQANALDEATRLRSSREVDAALAELRSALSRPLGRRPRPVAASLRAAVEQLRSAHPALGLDAEGEVAAPAELEPLAQSVLVEAVRNADKHAQPSRVRVRTASSVDTFEMIVTNDGVVRSAHGAGVGLRLAAFEALAAGGLLEFGPREEGSWQVRLVVPLGTNADPT